MLGLLRSQAVVVLNDGEKFQALNPHLKKGALFFVSLFHLGPQLAVLRAYSMLCAQGSWWGSGDRMGIQVASAMCKASALPGVPSLPFFVFCFRGLPTGVQGLLLIMHTWWVLGKFKARSLCMQSMHSCPPVISPTKTFLKAEMKQKVKLDIQVYLTGNVTLSF